MKILFVVALAFVLTPARGARADALTPNLNLLREGKALEVVGRDEGLGNVVGVSPYFEAADFETEETFHAKIAGYLAVLDNEGWLTARKTVVVFPELTGLWLIALGDGDLTQTKPFFGLPASEVAVLKIGLKYQKGLFPDLIGAITHIKSAVSTFSDDYLANIIRAKADVIAGAYDRTFSELARKYQVAIMAGSIALPEPSIINMGDTTALGFDPNGPIRNTLVSYSPEGKIVSLVKKVHVPGGEGFTEEAPLEDLEPVETGTSVGLVGGLICADSWFKDTFEKMKPARFVVIPEYADTAHHMAQVWHGYSLAKIDHFLTPQEVHDIAGIDDLAQYTIDSSGDFSKGALSEHGALLHYTGPFWGRQLGIPYTMVVPNRAQFLDKGSDNGFVVTAPWLTLPLVRKASDEARATLMNVYIAK